MVKQKEKEGINSLLRKSAANALTLMGIGAVITLTSFYYTGSVRLDRIESVIKEYNPETMDFVKDQMLRMTKDMEELRKNQIQLTIDLKSSIEITNSFKDDTKKKIDKILDILDNKK